MMVGIDKERGDGMGERDGKRERGREGARRWEREERDGNIEG